MKLSTINAIVFSLSLLFSIQLLKAQTSFFIGPMGSVGLSKYQTSDDFSQSRFYGYSPNDFSLTSFQQDLESKAKLSFSGGVKFGLQFGNFGFETGVRFFQKGGKFENRNFDFLDNLLTEVDVVDEYGDIYSVNLNQTGVFDIGTFIVEEKQNFVHIPVLARYKVFGEEIGFMVAMGPAFNIGVGKVERDINFRGEVAPEQVKFDQNIKSNYGKDISDLYKPVTVSLILSAGVIIPVSEQGKLNLSLIYEGDLGNSVNDNYMEVRYDANYDELRFFDREGDRKLRNFSIGISYEHYIDFNIGDKY